MKRLALFDQKKIQSIGIIAFFLFSIMTASCGLQGTQTSSPIDCSSGVAAIIVFDNGMKRGCGCTEAADVSFGPGSTFNCTITNGTLVNFYFSTVQQQHQVYVTGLQTWVVDPDAENDIQVRGQRFDSTGSFNFGDTTTNVSGTIIVN